MRNRKGSCFINIRGIMPGTIIIFLLFFVLFKLFVYSMYDK